MTRILIVDDSLFQRRIISAPLKNEGYEVIEAFNGKSGLEKISAQKPDLILLDILMPEIDGFEVLKDLQINQNKIPVIMLTSDVQDSTREQCLALGARAFLNKPVKSEDLIPIIRSVLGEKP
ncbi:MAG: response regulator [Methanomicrobiales archaeon HGW-Methanomicrobiales-4]|nr:MAG: response regulator [Methanomicrobiales archaeon HGW-Methanomicrobiales-4]